MTTKNTHPKNDEQHSRVQDRKKRADNANPDCPSPEAGDLSIDKGSGGD